MPFTINGIGTKVYQGRGNVGWRSFDAVEWFVLAYVPLIPISAVHTFNWSGNKYQQIPIRWSAALVVRSFLRAWHWFFLIVGCILLLIGIFMAAAHNAGQEVDAVVMLTLGALLAGAGVLLHFVLAYTDRRTQDIRRVLGPYQLGSCDPALLKKPMNPDPRALYGAETYADAVPALLDTERYSRAMWAARLSTVWEDPALGEELTDHVLNHPGVPEAIEQVRRKPRCWAEVMLTPAERQAKAQSVDPKASRAEALNREFGDGPPEKRGPRRR